MCSDGTSGSYGKTCNLQIDGVQGQMSDYFKRAFKMDDLSIAFKRNINNYPTGKPPKLTQGQQQVVISLPKCEATDIHWPSNAQFIKAGDLYLSMLSGSDLSNMSQSKNWSNVDSKRKWAVWTDQKLTPVLKDNDDRLYTLDYDGESDITKPMYLSWTPSSGHGPITKPYFWKGSKWAVWTPNSDKSQVIKNTNGDNFIQYEGGGGYYLSTGPSKKLKPILPNTSWLWGIFNKVKGSASPINLVK
jgi:hypothetical protein